MKLTPTTDLSLTGLNAKTYGDNLCSEHQHKLSPGDNSCRRQFVPATIHAVIISMNRRRRRFMPWASAWIVAGDNSCRNTCNHETSHTDFPWDFPWVEDVSYWFRVGKIKVAMHWLLKMVFGRIAKQLWLMDWWCPSVCLSVRPSVCPSVCQHFG